MTWLWVARGGYWCLTGAEGFREDVAWMNIKVLLMASSGCAIISMANVKQEGFKKQVKYLGKPTKRYSDLPEGLRRSPSRRRSKQHWLWCHRSTEIVSAIDADVYISYDTRLFERKPRLDIVSWEEEEGFLRT